MPLDWRKHLAVFDPPWNPLSLPATYRGLVSTITSPFISLEGLTLTGMAQLQHRGNEMHRSAVRFRRTVIIVTHLQAAVPVLPMSHIIEWSWKGGFLWAYIGSDLTANWPKAHLHSGKLIMGLFGGTVNEKVTALWLNSAHRSADASRWHFYWVWYGYFVCMIRHLAHTLGTANFLATPLVLAV